MSFISPRSTREIFNGEPVNIDVFKEDLNQVDALRSKRDVLKKRFNGRIKRFWVRADSERAVVTIISTVRPLTPVDMLDEVHKELYGITYYAPVTDLKGDESVDLDVMPL